MAFLPFGFSSFSTLNLNTIPYGSNFNYQPLQLPFNSSFNSTDPVLTLDPSQLIGKATEANKSGKFDWERALQMTIIYGGSALKALTNAGIIKDKNALVNGQIDSTKLNQVLNESGGDFSKIFEKYVGSEPEANTPAPETKSSIFTLQNALIATILVGGTYFLTKSEPKKKNR
jgi:hypothetical protein